MSLAKRVKPSRETISFKDLIVSFNEKFDDYVIYNPWNPKEYIVEIGTRSFGFGEKSYLISTLNKVRKDYGDEIPVSVIVTKVIPEISEPLIRRHGSNSYLANGATYISKWMVYMDDEMTSPLIFVKPSYEGEPQHMEILEKELGRPPKPSGKHVRGYFAFFPLLYRAGALVVGEHGFRYKDFKDILDAYMYNEAKKFNFFAYPSTEEIVNESDKIFLYASKPKKQIRIRTVGKPLTKEHERLIEDKYTDAVNWEIITGDDNSNRRPNEPEWWVPVRQTTQGGG